MNIIYQVEAMMQRTKGRTQPCCSCKYRGDLFKLGDGGIPHCHCHHPSIPPDKFGWDTLQEAFWTCNKFERREQKQPELAEL
jgi:hypothetical protein